MFLRDNLEEQLSSNLQRCTLRSKTRMNFQIVSKTKNEMENPIQGTNWKIKKPIVSHEVIRRQS